MTDTLAPPPPPHYAATTLGGCVAAGISLPWRNRSNFSFRAILLPCTLATSTLTSFISAVMSALRLFISACISVLRSPIAEIIWSNFLSCLSVRTSKSRTRFWVTNHTPPAVARAVERDIRSKIGIVIVSMPQVYGTPRKKSRHKTAAALMIVTVAPTHGCGYLSFKKRLTFSSKTGKITP